MQNELYHHGILGMHWGVTRTKEYFNSKRRTKGLNDANTLAKTHAELEDMSRSLTNGVKPGETILTSKDTKRRYEELLNNYTSQLKRNSKNYNHVTSEVVSDKGKDYVVTMLNDKETGDSYTSQVPLRNRRP